MRYYLLSVIVTANVCGWTLIAKSNNQSSLTIMEISGLLAAFTSEKPC